MLSLFLEFSLLFSSKFGSTFMLFWSDNALGVSDASSVDFLDLFDFFRFLRLIFFLALIKFLVELDLERRNLPPFKLYADENMDFLLSLDVFVLYFQACLWQQLRHRPNIHGSIDLKIL